MATKQSKNFSMAAAAAQSTPAPVLDTPTPVVTETTAVTAPAAEIKPVETVIAPVVSAPAPKTAAELLADLQKTGNVAAINSVTAVFDYVQCMKPGMTMSADVGARHQVSLYRALKNTIEYSGDQFQLAFSAVLRLVEEQKNDTFGAQYVYRFMESVALSETDRRCFERLVNLLKVTCSVTGRKESLKQVSFEKTLAEGFTDVSKQKIQSYFGV